jgi:uncharacterized membrane protein (UPF0127 family)
MAFARRRDLCGIWGAQVAEMGSDAWFVSVHNETRDQVLSSRVRVADTTWARLVGLVGQRTLAPGSGLWITPSNSIHTFGMRFPFDAVFINRSCRVVGLHAGLRPFRITLPDFKAWSVLELPAGTISSSRTEIGDQLLIRRTEHTSTAEKD